VTDKYTGEVATRVALAADAQAIVKAIGFAEAAMPDMRAFAPFKRV
jgi:hypothetical protein